MVKVNLSTLPQWKIMLVEHKGLCVVTHDNEWIVASHLSETEAAIIAMTPAMVAFMGSLIKRPNAPAALDVGRVLKLHGVEIVQDI